MPRPSKDSKTKAVDREDLLSLVQESASGRWFRSPLSRQDHVPRKEYGVSKKKPSLSCLEGDPDE